MANRTFLTDHAHVLLCVARDSGIRHRNVAVRVVLQPDDRPAVTA